MIIITIIVTLNVVIIPVVTVDPDSVVSTVTNRLRDGRSEFRFRAEQGFFLFSETSKPTLEPKQHLIQWIPGTVYSGAKGLGREFDHSPPSISILMVAIA
jgi:hypothetical protein